MRRVAGVAPSMACTTPHTSLASLRASSVEANSWKAAAFALRITFRASLHACR